jgi:hypothetical protein
MRSVSAEGGQAGMKRGSHNDRVPKIVRSESKPAEFKAKREIRLTIVNRLANLSYPITC